MAQQHASAILRTRRSAVLLRLVGCVEVVETHLFAFADEPRRAAGRDEAPSARDESRWCVVAVGQSGARGTHTARRGHCRASRSRRVGSSRGRRSARSCGLHAREDGTSRRRAPLALAKGECPGHVPCAVPSLPQRTSRRRSDRWRPRCGCTHSASTAQQSDGGGPLLRLATGDTSHRPTARALTWRPRHDRAPWPRCNSSAGCRTVAAAWPRARSQLVEPCRRPPEPPWPPFLQQAAPPPPSARWPLVRHVRAWQTRSSDAQQDQPPSWAQVFVRCTAGCGGSATLRRDTRHYNSLPRSHTRQRRFRTPAGSGRIHARESRPTASQRASPRSAGPCQCRCCERRRVRALGATA
jgi:hypothetical protein